MMRTKNPRSMMKFVAVYLLSILSLTACGEWGWKFSGSGSGGADVTISGTLSDAVSAPKFKSAQGYGNLYAVSDWAGALIQVIDSSGNILAETIANAAGSFSVSVPPGTNYFIKATIGNLVLKAFLESVESNRSDVPVNPKSSAEVKILGSILGDADVGEPGNDVSIAINNIDIPTTMTSIESSSGLDTVATAIALDIADNYDANATGASVGTAGTAGDSTVSDIASSIITIAGDGGSDGTTPAGDGGGNWDDMKWNQDNWG